MTETWTLADDARLRHDAQPNEHPLLTRLVVLRIALNKDFGGRFSDHYDHEMAQLELRIADVIAAAQLVVDRAETFCQGDVLNTSELEAAMERAKG